MRNVSFSLGCYFYAAPCVFQFQFELLRAGLCRRRQNSKNSVTVVQRDSREAICSLPFWCFTVTVELMTD